MKRAARPDRRVQRGELVVARRDDRAEVLAHQVGVVLERLVHAREEDALRLEVVAVLVVHDLGLVLGRDARRGTCARPRGCRASRTSSSSPPGACPSRRRRPRWASGSSRCRRSRCPACSWRTSRASACARSACSDVAAGTPSSSPARTSGAEMSWTTSSFRPFLGVLTYARGVGPAELVLAEIDVLDGHALRRPRRPRDFHYEDSNNP